MTSSEMDAGQSSLEVQQDVSLTSYSGMATPCRARYLVHVSSIESLVAALTLARNRKLQWRVLGEGSNTVFIRDFDGLIIVVQMLGIRVEEESTTQVKISVAAGENWHALVQLCVKNGWYGLENLALIPGLVGAAPIQNIGAYGVELKQFVDAVSYYDVSRQQHIQLLNQDCGFAYRDSIFKRKLSDRAVITRLWLTLSKRPLVNLSYVALADMFKDDTPTPEQVFDAVCTIRMQKLPLPSDIPNCGSFFKNPLVSHALYEGLVRRYPDIVGYAANDGYKLAAGWLIEKAGWKQKQIQGVRVHQHQALVVINPEKAEGQHIASFAKAIQRDIEQRFGVMLEIEPNLI